jgi:Fe2+ or Zn2+ uptake regulation protein
MTGYKTEQRSLLMEFLQHNPDRQFSAREIAARIPSTEISLSAIYRNLSALESAGLINRFVKEGSREVYYQYTRCGTVPKPHSPDLYEMRKNTSRRARNGRPFAIRGSHFRGFPG